MSSIKPLTTVSILYDTQVYMYIAYNVAAINNFRVLTEIYVHMNNHYPHMANRTPYSHCMQLCIYNYTHFRINFE